MHHRFDTKWFSLCVLSLCSLCLCGSFSFTVRLMLSVVGPAGRRFAGPTRPSQPDRESVAELRRRHGFPAQGAGDEVRLAQRLPDALRGHFLTGHAPAALGRHAGNNAAAELIGVAPTRYSQPKYVTCLDLGAWGAVFSEGWERRVKLVGSEAKALKQQINSQWIYPPAADRALALAAADPAIPVA